MQGPLGFHCQKATSLGSNMALLPHHLPAQASICKTWKRFPCSSPSKHFQELPGSIRWSFSSRTVQYSCNTAEHNSLQM